MLAVADRLSKRTPRASRTSGRADAIWVGIAQALALIPGTSRSGATITAGLFLGLNREAAARFSFLLSIPAIVLSGLYGLTELATGDDSVSFGALAVSTVFAFIFGYVSIAFLLRYLANHSMMIFVIYRIVLGAVIDRPRRQPARSASHATDAATTARSCSCQRTSGSSSAARSHRTRSSSLSGCHRGAPRPRTRASGRPAPARGHAARTGGRGRTGARRRCTPGGPRAATRRPEESMNPTDARSSTTGRRALRGQGLQQARRADQVELALGEITTRSGPCSAWARKVEAGSLAHRRREYQGCPPLGTGSRRAVGGRRDRAQCCVDAPSCAHREPVMPTDATLDAAERERLIVEHLPLVRGLARRYADRGEPLDDLVQVGTIGLIKAIDRFEPERGFKLASFATPTILGRDPPPLPRPLVDRAGAARHPGGPRADLPRRRRALGRERPQPVGARDRRVDRPARWTRCSTRSPPAAPSAPPRSPRPAARARRTAASRSGVDEAGLRAGRGPRDADAGLAALPARERVILHLRFEEGLTQSQIA